jgi:hypothetical protein
MAIEHTCQCGTKLRVKDELAGKKIKCPKCSKTFTLPAGQAALDLISVSCKCGKSFQAKATMAGKSFQCISCNRTISIPPFSITNKAPSSNKTVPDYRGIPARPGIQLNFNQDVLIIVTAVLCILYTSPFGNRIERRLV